jgi:putative flippase GtrA
MSQGLPMSRLVSMRLVRKLLRYASVSAIATTVSLSILGVLVATGATTPGWANVVATAAGTIPSFELNRRWVWGKSGRRSVWAEIGPFCLLAFVELALSTLAVSAASGWAATAGFGVTARTLVAEGANVTTFATLWVAQYLILDRVLFHTRRVAIDGDGPALRADDRPPVGLPRAA